jgi:hypothetical protein
LLRGREVQELKELQRQGIAKRFVSMNRHGILRGEIVAYGTETNSLKVFLLLDTIQQFPTPVVQRCKTES